MTTKYLSDRLIRIGAFALALFLSAFVLVTLWVGLTSMALLVLLLNLI